MTCALILEWICYNDVIMNAMASQITSLTIVYSTVYSCEDQRKYQSSGSLAFVMGISPVTGEFPAQRASNTEDVSIWWRHHVTKPLVPFVKFFGINFFPELSRQGWTSRSYLRVTMRHKCADTCEIWMWSIASIIYFCTITTVTNKAKK